MADLVLKPGCVRILQASTLIQQMYAPDDRPRIIAVSADTLQVRANLPSAFGCLPGKCLG